MSTTSGAQVTTPAAHRPDESMNLLLQVMENPLDPGYADVARRRERAGEPPARMPLWRRLPVMVMAALLGLGAVWAARTLQTPELVADDARTLLIEEIHQRSAQVETLSSENEQLSAEIAELQLAQLSSTDPVLAGQLDLWGFASGQTTVSGPGVVVLLADSPRSRTDPTLVDERVQDVDLQVLVNGLWSAGAEAITINGYRVGSLTSIRAAGQAVLLDLVPLTPPYAVAAIGDPDGLRTGLARTPASRHLAVLRDRYSISVEIEVAPQIVAAAAASVPLRHVEASSATPQEDLQ